VRHLTVLNAEGRKALDDVSFTAYSGEILGIAGISGCGQKELLEAIAGLQKCEEGSSILFDSPQGIQEQLVGKTPKKIREYGVHLSYVPEDRLGMGLVGSMGMTENMMLKEYQSGPLPFLQTKEPEELANTVKNRLLVDTPSLSTPVRKLSGGNIQKVLVGREIAMAPTVLMTAYAVRGLDINTSYTIYHLLNEQKEAGVAVIYVGEDLDVLLALSDRILVLSGGQVTGLVDARSADKQQLGLLMTQRKGVQA
jgi:simple sugar transport system ATP-binding protein